MTFMGTTASLMKRLGQVTLGFWTFASGATAAPTPKLLSDIRSQLVVPSYTQVERQTIADQSFLMLDQLFVHRELKVQEFGAAHDPVPRMTEIKRQASTMEDAALQDGILSIFNDIHDLHSNFVLPPPLACAVAFTPLQFTGVKDGVNEKVLVSGILSLGTEYVKDVKEGFELVSVDGRPVSEVLAELEALSGGANPDAMRFRAIQLLNMRSLSTHKVPEEDTRKLTLSGPSGTIDIEMPWLTLMDDECLTGASTLRRMPFSHAMLMAEDDFQKRYNRIYGQPSLVPMMAPEAATANPYADIFEVALLNTPAGQLGYIQLKSFYWTDENLAVGTVVQAFRTAVETELSSARALVIDVRGNPGGIITFAEKILQLFAPQGVEPTTVRMLANELNESIFIQSNNGEKNRWSETVRAAMTSGKTYTAPLAITPDSEANDIGQLWFRPVVVLTDAGCYSACDLFSAGMQDNKAAVILGTHGTTGAGGANVMDYSTFQAIMEGAPTNPFKKLPHQQSMRISWRQLLRAGVNRGKLIEGKGVISDVVIPLTPGDIQTESRALMGQIHKAIKDLEPQYQSSIKSLPHGYIRLANDTPGSWSEEVAGIDRLVVSAGNDVLIDQNVAMSHKFVTVPIEIPSLSANWRDQLITVKGWREGRQVFRVVRTLAWRGDYLKVTSGEALALDFESGDLGPFQTFDLHDKDAQGWQTLAGKMQIGDKATYAGNLHARALLPLDLNGKGAKVSFEIAVKAEDLYDSFRLFAVNPDTGVRMEFFSGSEVPEQTTDIELPKGWNRADLVFEFESDENWHLKGPTIDNVKIQSGN